MATGPKINCGSDDRQVVDRVVIAIDANVAGVIQQKSGEDDFYQDAVDGPALRKPHYKPAFEKLKNADCHKDQLLVRFVDGGEKNQRDNKQQPDNINPVDSRNSLR